MKPARSLHAGVRALPFPACSTVRVRVLNCVLTIRPPGRKQSNPESGRQTIPKELCDSENARTTKAQACSSRRSLSAQKVREPGEALRELLFRDERPLAATR